MKNAWPIWASLVVLAVQWGLERTFSPYVTILVVLVVIVYYQLNRQLASTAHTATSAEAASQVATNYLKSCYYGMGEDMPYVCKPHLLSCPRLAWIVPVYDDGGIYSLFPTR